MNKICKLFACVYATRDGCAINGHLDQEGQLNGVKAFCPIYKVMCITAKCKACGHEGAEGCINSEGGKESE